MPRPLEPARSSRFVILAAICVVVAALYFAQDVLIPLALSVLLCFLLAPLVRRLERVGLSRVPAVIVVVTLASGVVVALTWATTVQIFNLADRLPEYRGEIVDKVHNLKRNFGSSGGIMDKVKVVAEDVQKASTQPADTPASTQPAATQAVANTAPPDAPADVPGPIEQLASDPKETVAREIAGAPPPVAPPIGTTRTNPLWTVALPEPSTPIGTMWANVGLVLSPLATAGLVLIFVIFMLIQREDLRDRIIRLVGKGQLHVTTNALDDAGTRISRYMLAQAIVNGSYGIAVALGLWVIGQFVGDKPFPSFVLWGLLCALLRFIPYIGPWIAASFPILLSLAVYHGFAAFFCTAGMFIVIELLSNNFMEPWLYGSSTGMTTIAVLVSAVFWTWLWGPIGLLLATPLTVCLVVLGKHVPQLQFFDILLGDEPVLESSARVYQRLLALDQEEAAELVHGYLKEKSLEETYDEVLLPALAMAEQDRHKGNLDEERGSFVMQSMRDLVEELADAARAAEEQRAGSDLREAAAANVAVAKGQAPAETSTPSSPAPAAGGNGSPPAPAASAVSVVRPPRPSLPAGCTVNVLCLPARDDGDDIANVMLANLLELRGYCSTPIAVAALASEMVDGVEKHKADVVVVSALPPGAVAGSRYLCKRLHARHPEVPMAIGLWTVKADLKKARERITCDANVQLATTFSAILDIIHQMAQPAVARQAGSLAAGSPAGSAGHGAPEAREATAVKPAAE